MAESPSSSLDKKLEMTIVVENAANWLNSFTNDTHLTDRTTFVVCIELMLKQDLSMRYEMLAKRF